MDWENLLDYIFSSLFAQHKVAKIFTMALEKDNSNPDLKSSFRSRNIQFFVFLSFILFLPAIALEYDQRQILKFMTSSIV